MSVEWDTLTPNHGDEVFGEDGGNAELRPPPAITPEKLLVNIRKALELGKDYSKPKTWMAGSYPRDTSLGGHIHFDSRVYRISEHTDYPTVPELPILDNTIGCICACLENKKERKRRLDDQYGLYSDIRDTAHGGIEYRTPASWLVSPRVTLGVLSLAFAVAEYSGKFEIDTRLYANDNYLEEIAQHNIKAIRKWDSYEKYKDNIEGIFTLVEAGKSWEPNKSLAELWEL